VLLLFGSRQWPFDGRANLAVLLCEQRRGITPTAPCRTRGHRQMRSSDTERQPPDTGERRRSGLLSRCLLTFTGKSFVLPPDDSFDDDAYGQERTQSNPQALLRQESRAAASMCDQTRTSRNVFLNHVSPVRFLSGPPSFPSPQPLNSSRLVPALLPANTAASTVPYPHPYPNARQKRSFLHSLTLRLSSSPAGSRDRRGIRVSRRDTTATGTAVHDTGAPAEPFWRQRGTLWIRSRSECPRHDCRCSR
jgi:hypothetical protein